MKGAIPNHLPHTLPGLSNRHPQDLQTAAEPTLNEVTNSERPHETLCVLHLPSIWRGRCRNPNPNHTTKASKPVIARSSRSCIQTAIAAAPCAPSCIDVWKALDAASLLHCRESIELVLMESELVPPVVELLLHTAPQPRDVLVVQGAEDHVHRGPPCTHAGAVAHDAKLQRLLVVILLVEAEGLMERHGCCAHDDARCTLRGVQEDDLHECGLVELGRKEEALSEIELHGAFDGAGLCGRRGGGGEGLRRPLVVAVGETHLDEGFEVGACGGGQQVRHFHDIAPQNDVLALEIGAPP
mmetsp:Transcript_68612/g.184741  ORF Transcript_68612/g.184741 Transcript_68612/m.184741 type:complete len:298 (-) Transcript_68612:337-1230(-)